MYFRLILTSLLFMLFLYMKAQESYVVVQGRIKFSGGELQEALIVIKKDNKMLASSFSDDDGFYRLKFIKTEGLTIEANYLGFKKSVIDLDQLDTGIELINQDFFLEENASLAEIIIRPKNVEPDTVNFNLNKYGLKPEDNLSEILRKNPNFKLDEDGSIIYKGKSIDKILVNGKDYFSNQNTIALEKIEYNMLNNIQIINNYKNAFSLDETIEDETVLNLGTKDQYKNITTGSIASGIGYENKFDAQGSLLRFSPSINGFLVSNTNNTGQPVIKLREIQNLFSNQQPVSSFLGEAINELFIGEEGKKRLISNSNLTQRKQTSKSRLNTSSYYIHSNKENELMTHIFDDREQELWTNHVQTSYSVNSFFNNTSYDYAINKDQLLNYSMSAIALYQKKNYTNNIFERETTNDINIFSHDNPQILSLYNSISYSKRANSKILLIPNLIVYNENIDSNNALESNELSLFEQKKEFRKNYLSVGNKINWKTSNTHTLSFNSYFNYTNEHFNMKQRQQEKYWTNLNINGVNVFEKMYYLLSIGIEHHSIKYNDNQKNSLFIPYNLDIKYENHLNRWYASSFLRQDINSIHDGDSILKNNDNILIGNKGYPLETYNVHNVKLGYSYNNTFLSKQFGVSLDYSFFKDQLKETFIDIDNYGIVLDSVIPSNIHELKILVNASQLLFKTSKYPVKVDYSFRYKSRDWTILKNDINKDAISYRFDNVLNLSTVTNHSFNFEFYARYLFEKSRLDKTKINSNSFHTYFKLKYDLKKIKADVSYLYSSEVVMGKRYSKQNINLNTTYNLNKKITVQVQGENIDQFFSLFKNNTYGTRFSFENNLNKVKVNIQDLNYIILKIKYDF